MRQTDTSADPSPQGPPRCIACAYVLVGLPTPGRCPECARDFDLRDASTFTTLRPFLGWKYWASGVAVAGGVGLVLLVVDFLVLGAAGWSVWLGTPLVMGLVCGYYARVRTYALGLLSLLLLAVLLLLVAGAGIGGVFCAMVLAGFAAVPIAIGAGAGHVARLVMKAKGYDLRRPLVLLLLLGAGIGMGVVDRLTTPARGVRVVSTERVIEQPIDLVWAGVMFYEEVRHDPPLILRVGLVRPLRTEGTINGPGDVKVCVYNKGRLTKRAAVVAPPRLLEFEVIEQRIGYERDVRLTGGSFSLEPLGPGRTRVTLSTRYEPLLSPRGMWAWGEDWAVHTLHGHVLEGMVLEAERLWRLGTVGMRGEGR